jgi:pyridoxamine 5'-phosphate oxidase
MLEPTSPPPALSLAELRRSYTLGGLDESQIHPDAIVQFEKWFEEARRSGITEPNAMTLATSTPDGTPSARIVLLKHVGAEGFVFFTNYDSRKGAELAANPKAALIFYWADLERQVRIEGNVTRVCREQSARYFALRPKGSRLGALASPTQSAVIEGRTILEARLQELELRFRDSDDVPLPDFWGGYCVHPRRIEFWQGRQNRLHDRLCFERQQPAGWRIVRLSP